MCLPDFDNSWCLQQEQALCIELTEAQDVSLKLLLVPSTWLLPNLIQSLLNGYSVNKWW